MSEFLMHPVATVLVANAMWLAVCTIWALLCFAQAKADKANGVGFQKRIGVNDID
jgi:hypothetical protein